MNLLDLLDRVLFAPADDSGAPVPAAPAATPAAPAPGTPEAAPTGNAAPPAEGKPPEGNGKAAPETKPGETVLGSQPKAPEPVTYGDFALPEGMKADDPTLTAFKDSASKLGVSQEHAQALIDAVAPALKANAEAAVKQWNDLNTEWQAQVRKDYQGAAFDTMKTNVARAFDEFAGTPDSADRKALNEALLLTGAGNNPHIVRLIARMAEALAEGAPVNGRAPASAKRDLAALMYPSHNQSSE